MDHTHAQRNFRVDANKEYDWDASVAIISNQNFAPNTNSKLVAQLDVKLTAIVHFKQADLQLFFLNFSQLYFFALFFLLLF